MADVTAFNGARIRSSSERIEAALEMIRTCMTAGARDFDVSVIEHVVAVDGSSFDRRVAGKQLTRALPAELRGNIARILQEAEESHWSVILRPRPAAGRMLIQLDDLRYEKIEQLKPYAFLIVCTSPGNFQVWMAVSDPPPGKEAADFARRLRRGVGADERANGAGRIAGSRNYKPRRGPEFPLVEIVHMQPGRIVACTELERAGFLACKEPASAPPPARQRPARQGYPDYALVLRGAPMRHDGSGRDRSRADAFWAKWSAERGYSVNEVAAELGEISEKAREQLGRGNTNYALEKAQWGNKKARMPATQNAERSFSEPLYPLKAKAVDFSRQASSAPQASAPLALPEDLAALVDSDLGIEADLFIAPLEPPPERSLPASPGLKAQGVYRETEGNLFRGEFEEAETDKDRNSSKGRPYDIYPD